MPIDYSARLGALDRWKNDLAMSSPEEVFRQFWRVMQPTPEMRVADFGVSGHRDHPAHYFFETPVSVEGSADGHRPGRRERRLDAASSSLG